MDFRVLSVPSYDEAPMSNWSKMFDFFKWRTRVSFEDQVVRNQRAIQQLKGSTPEAQMMYSRNYLAYEVSTTANILCKREKLSQKNSSYSFDANALKHTAA